MPRSPMRNLADLLVTSGDLQGTIPNNRLTVESGSSVSTLADMDALIAKTGMAAGDQAYVQSNNNLYLYNGAGWYLVATVANAQPTTISGVESSYLLANDGTATTITAISTDPEGFPLTWSYAVTTGALGSTATVSQTDNVFTITPSTNTANAGEFSITFSVTDGSTGVVSAVSAFTLSFAVPWTVDLSNVTYDNVSFSLASQDSQAGDINFNTDGTKMYMMGGNSDSVYQYSLSTGFDLSTASYDSVSFSLASQDTHPQTFAFNTDGTKMYVAGNGNDSVYQYSLSTGFDLSTASYDNISFSVSSQDAYPSGLCLSTDGTKMYVSGPGNDSVYQYSLSTGFDLSTASYDNVSFSTANQDINPSDINFNTDGTKMYVFGRSNQVLYQYGLSTAFDLSTASYDNISFDVNSIDYNTYGFAFKTDGTKMYTVSNYNLCNVYQYSTGL